MSELLLNPSMPIHAAEKLAPVLGDAFGTTHTLLTFVYGAPPVTGQAEYLDDVEL